MKKDISSSLAKLAEALPTVFEEKEGTVLMTGKELKLTPVADEMELEDDTLYAVPVPEFHAVEHKQQVKDAYKRGGFSEVEKYVQEVLNKVKGGVLTMMPVVE